MVGAGRIELPPHAPHARVLPLYYAPQYYNKISRLFLFVNEILKLLNNKTSLLKGLALNREVNNRDHIGQAP